MVQVDGSGVVVTLPRTSKAPKGWSEEVAQVPPAENKNAVVPLIR